MLIKYRFAFIWSLFILLLCGINGNSLPKVSFDIGLDKMAHLILFGILSFLIASADHRGAEKALWVKVHKAVLISIVYGVLIEVLQALVFVNRTYDYADMLANASGAVTCYLLMYYRFRSE